MHLGGNERFTFGKWLGSDYEWYNAMPVVLTHLQKGRLRNLEICIAYILIQPSQIEDMGVPVPRNQEYIIKCFCRLRGEFCDHLFGELLENYRKELLQKVKYYANFSGNCRNSMIRRLCNVHVKYMYRNATTHYITKLALIVITRKGLCLRQGRN